MKPIRLFGVVVFGIGAVLLVSGYHASNAPLDQLSNALSGRFTDRTMWYFIIGAAAATGGMLLAVFGK